METLFQRNPDKLTDSTAASHDISPLIAKKRNKFSGGEELIRLSLETAGKSLGDKTIEEKVFSVPLTRSAVTRRIEEFARM
jgi:hypothetical protein